MSPWLSTGAAGVDFAQHASGRLGKDEGTVPPVLKWRWGGRACKDFMSTVLVSGDGVELNLVPI